MVILDPCGLCHKPVAKNHRSVQCDVCKFWIHIKCNNIPPSVYNNELIDDNKNPWICLKCINEALPFSEYDNKSFFLTQKGITIENNLEILDLSMSTKDKNIMKKISNLIIENTNPDNKNSKFCKFYNLDEFAKAKFKSDHNFSILHLNIASLQYHIEDLKILIKVIDYNFDVIAISESKLMKDSPPIKDLTIPNYQYIHTPTEASKGGTLMYFSDKLIYKPRKDLELYQSKQVESTFAEVIMPKGKNLIVGCIYKHHNIDQEQFSKMIYPLLEKLNKERKNVYIAGDFNIDLIKMEKEPKTKLYFDTITNAKFMPLITLPTRITSSTKTLIDNILTNQFSSDIKSGNLSVSISDHIPQFVIFPLQHKNFLPKDHNIKIRDVKNIDQPNLMNELSKINWYYTKETSSSNVNDDTSTFLNQVNSIIDKYAPLKKITNKEYKLRSKPWITKGILKAIKIRDNIFHRLSKEKNKSKKDNLSIKLKYYKNKIKQLLRTTKSDYYNKFFTDNIGNAKQLWKGINEIISTKNKSAHQINCIEAKDDIKSIKNLTDPKDIAGEFNVYFTNIAADILKERKYKGNKLFTNYLKNMNPNTFLITPTDIKEVEIILKSIDPTKSVGPNSIPPKLLKQISPIISIPITNICNKSFSSGIYPNQFKTSKVIPIHKKDSKLKTSNYRPISLLSNLNKVLEKLMFNRLFNFLDTFNCLYELQFGFREKHSTNHAILSITQKIQEAIFNDKPAIGVFVDFQKAFDTVNHKILLYKLSHYGIRGTANKWFTSYLTDRKQFVSINGTNSAEANINHGVPQGSVLGPLLFLIYINDLHQCIKNSNTFHFADDTNLLYIPDKKIRNRNLNRRLNIDLKSLNHWLLANKISLNSTKTELIYFRKKNKIIPHLNIKLNGVKLQPSHAIKYLGLTFDEHLTFNNHINILNAKLKRSNNLIALSRHYVPLNLLKQIYFGQFQSHLMYGCQVWGSKIKPSSQTFVLQKKALRLISFKNKRAHSDPLFKEHGIMKLNDLITTNNVTFVHNTLNGKVPTHFKEYFEKYIPPHSYQTTRNTKSIASLLVQFKSLITTQKL